LPGRSRRQNAGREEKSATLEQFVLTTGYNRKHALRFLNKPAQAQTLLFVKGKPVKFKPAKPKPVNREGKKIYTSEATAPSASSGHSSGLSAASSRRLSRAGRWTMPPTIDRALKKGRVALPIPRPNLSSNPQASSNTILYPRLPHLKGTETPRFYPNRPVRHCGQAASGRYVSASAESGWISLPFPLMDIHNDNGGGFVNQSITVRRRSPARPISLSRSRYRKKNDNCIIEQKNGAGTHRHIGYGRLEGDDLQSRLAAA
jgi:hypothetical protein